MDAIAIYWNDRDNFVGVIIRDKSKSVEEQVEDYKANHNRKSTGYYGVEIEIDEA